MKPEKLISNKTLFEYLLNQAAKPLKSTAEKEIDNHSDDYNDKKTHSHSSEDISDLHDDKSHE